MKTRTRVLSVVMTVALLLSSLIIVIPTSAVTVDADAFETALSGMTANSTWTQVIQKLVTDGLISDDINTALDGDGTSASPYQINNAYDLAYMAYYLNSHLGTGNASTMPYRYGVYEVTANIDTTAYQWVPIGNTYNNAATTDGSFHGTFNGNGYLITTKVSTATGQNSTSTSTFGGLFGACRDGAKLNGINLKTTLIANITTSNGFHGGLTGIAFGTQITDCHVDVTWTGATTAQGYWAAMVGYNNGTGEYTNCSTTGKIQITQAKPSEGNGYSLKAAGFVGRLNGDGTTFTNCMSDVDIALVGHGSGIHMGGIVAEVNGTGNDKYNFNNCMFTGTVTAGHNAANTYAPTRAGALVGYIIVGAAKTLNVKGFVNASGAYGNFSKYGTSNSFGPYTNIVGTSNVENTVVNLYNCWTATPNAYDIFCQAAATVNATDSAGAVVKAYSVSEARQNITEAVQAVEFDRTTEGGKTVLSLPAGLAEVLSANGTLSVGINTTRTADSVENVSAGTVDFTVNATEGAATYNVTRTIKNKASAVLAGGLTIWDNWLYHASASLTGSGTSAAPYLIYTAEDLAYLSQFYMNREGVALSQVFYRLEDNIDLANREWTPIGHYMLWAQNDCSFNGTFNGNNKTISNMTITGSIAENMPAALFGANQNGANKMYDFTLTGKIDRTMNSDATARGTAGLVAFGSGSVVIENVVLDMDINVVITVGEAYVGGFVANSDSQIVKASTMNGSVTVTGKGVIPLAGGFVGKNAGICTLTSCVNNADVTVIATGSTGGVNSIAGGMIGCNAAANQAIVVNGCINNGAVISKGTTNNARVGGLAGNVGRGSKATTWTVNGFINTSDNIGYSSTVKTNAQMGASGAGSVFGYSEAGTVTINNVYTPYYSTLADMGSVGENVTLSGATKTGSKAYANNRAEYFEAGVEVSDGTATIMVDKVPFDAANYTGLAALKLTYGDTVIDLSVGKTVSEDGKYYVWTAPAIDGAKAKFSVTVNGVDYGADEASWAHMYAADSFAGGDGSETAPYQIATAAQLGYLAALINDPDTFGTYNALYYDIVADIDLSAHRWITIGIEHTKALTLKLDGAKSASENYTVSGIDMTDGYYHYAQTFIGRTAAAFSLSNINFNGVKVTDADGIGQSDVPGRGAIVNALYGAPITNVHVTNVDIHTNSPIHAYHSAIANYVNGGTVTNCSAAGKITVEDLTIDTIVGGLVARLRQGTVENCVNKVDVTAIVATDAIFEYGFVGGVAGVVGADGTAEVVNVKNCINQGKVVINASADSKIDYVSAAGIVGGVHYTGKSNDGVTVDITDCVNTGIMVANNEGTSDMSGTFGILGYNSATAIKVENCKSFTTSDAVGDYFEYASNTTTEAAPVETDVFNTDLGLTTMDKASIRIDDTDATNTGIRFDSYFTADALKAITDKGWTVEFGTIIAPTALFDGFGVKDLPAKVTVVYDLADYVANNKGQSGYTKMEGGKNYFNGALVEIQSRNYDRDFTAVAYMTITIEGVAYTVYADYNGEDARARNVYEIAYEAYNDRSDTLTEEYGCLTEDGNYSRYSQKQLDAIQAYMDSFTQAAA